MPRIGTPAASTRPDASRASALDDCWVVSSEASGGSTHTLHSPDGPVVSLWADARFGFLHVFMTREFPKDGGRVTAIVLEPMTARVDPFNSGIGLRWLTPEDGLSASWAIRYEHTKPPANQLARNRSALGPEGAHDSCSRARRRLPL